LALIRVSSQPKIHLYLKGDKPVWIRNEDQSIPARASDLQALLDRVRATDATGPNAIGTAAGHARDMFVTKAKDLSATFADRQASANRQRSPTFWEFSAIPERSLHIGLDAAVERQFTGAIYRLYPSLDRNRSVNYGQSIVDYEDRARSWYGYSYLDLDRDHEIAWELTEGGVIRAIGEASGRIDPGPADLWSLVDLFISVDSSLRLVHEVWSKFGYYGAGGIVVNLRVPKLAHAIGGRTH